MVSSHDLELSDAKAPLVWFLSVSFVVLTALFLLLYWLMQPSAAANPGMAAFRPPPGTRLEPLPRKMDAPELAELPLPQTSTLAAEHVETAEGKTEKAAKREARVAVKKRPQTRKRREYQDPSSAYAQDRAQSWSWF
jgi:hypothetical protein